MTAGTYTVTIKDANGCTKQQSVTITQVGTPVTATCKATNDNTLYFGYVGDQSETITVTPAGGVGPYTIKFTMSRPMLCNQVNDAGDEIWTASSGGTTTGNSCPVYPGVSTIAPVSIKTNAASYAITVTLMAGADIIATITDANGCTYSCTTRIHAEDVRCFSGNSTKPKVAVCHKTGSSSNPCVAICVDDNAVPAHLAHGDFLGKCTPNCLPPPVTRTIIPVVETEVSSFDVQVMNNPSSPNVPFKVKVLSSNKAEAIQLRVMDVNGKIIETRDGIQYGQIFEIGKNYHAGLYFIQVVQGDQRKVKRILKG